MDPAITKAGAEEQFERFSKACDQEESDNFTFDAANECLAKLDEDDDDSLNQAEWR